MEKLKEINEGNAEIRNVYFGFENLFPTQAKNKNISGKDTKKTKKNKSKNKKEKSKEKNINTFNQIKTLKNNEFDNSLYRMKGSKYSKKPVKIIKTDEEREQEYFEEKNKKKKT